ncbi:T9SS type A sorting domain-containing protein [candidate division KSB1 bacterium]|nr:T9SS type A sorting domain-containing protein [candidate division KSB1 bacterium]NIR70952.1 T9SS type A sorting domain-containing protein [candidate division KSB1 bacterium]NIS24688.1 T9SS type A sorting domain-containing protein [candidate division KSB1 bacterium]NIT71597.1 T9SS type A sorting domain-containing protein [candidate division KSB1 bacterium]NIU25301.1 T9SS type A sorting domain-containing protein [candidate division KSB1 bacterium]
MSRVIMNRNGMKLCGRTVIRTVATAVLISAILPLKSGRAQEPTVGVVLNDERAYDGFTLFAPLAHSNTYLIDNEGRLINSWESVFAPALSVYLLEDGSLLRAGDPGGNDTFTAGGDGGLVERFDWDGNLTWQFRYSNERHRLHHDIEPLPNGNVLMIAWELKTATEVHVAGGDTTLLSEGELWPDHIIEVQPTGPTDGEIVWEWHLWDHLIQDFDSTKANFGVVEDHPELVDINFLNNGRADWNHTNAVNYHPKLEQIVLSTPTLNEIWIIDHSTTTEEAAGHTGGNSGKGGDLLYRWGNPRVYRLGTRADQKLFFQHDAQWIEPDVPGAGNILIFNNGGDRPEGSFSTVDEIVTPIEKNGSYTRSPDLPFGPMEPFWSYRAENPSDFFSRVISGAQRLPNGNTLICSGVTGTFFEVTQEKEIVWRYINPATRNGIVAQGDTIPVVDGSHTNPVFRCTRYGRDFPGFVDKDLTPGLHIEDLATFVEHSEPVPEKFALFQNYPNPFNPATTIRYDLNQDVFVTLKIYNLRGQEIRTLVEADLQPGTQSVIWDGRDRHGHPVASGIYLYRIQAGDFHQVKKMSLLR